MALGGSRAKDKGQMHSMGVGKCMPKHVHATPANLGFKMVNVLSAASHSFFYMLQVHNMCQWGSHW
jgi:hypothetical protein